MAYNYRCPKKWDFMPTSGQEVNYDDILAGKRFWENLEREFKDKNKKDEHHNRKEDNRWGFFKHWLFLGIMSPIFGLLYAYVTVQCVLALVQVIKTVSIN